jgi:HK97 gp10 family phage protein
MARDGVSITITDTGVEDSLANLALRVPKARDKALREGAIQFAEELEAVTPVGPPRSPTKYGKGSKDYATTHMKDDVKYQKSRDGRYMVGYGKDTGWRAHFINDGTIYITPTFFFDKVVSAKLGQSYETVARVLKEELFK